MDLNKYIYFILYLVVNDLTVLSHKIKIKKMVVWLSTCEFIWD